MRKLVCLILALLMLVAFSGLALAESVSDGTSVNLGDGNMFTPSTKVTVTYVRSADAYSAASAHATGLYAFRTTQDKGIEKSDKNKTVGTCNTAGTDCTFTNRD